MKRPVIAVKDGEHFVRMVPYIYINGAWVPTHVQVYGAHGWETVGGAGLLFYNFLTYDGLQYNTTAQIQVREQEGMDAFITAENERFYINTIPGTDPPHSLLGLLTKNVILDTLVDSNNNDLQDNLGNTLVVIR